MTRNPPATMLQEAANLFALLGGMGRKHLIVIGGLVPPLLAPEHAESHVGSADVDLCLSVAITQGRTAAYKAIQDKITPYFEAVPETAFRWRKKPDAPGIPLVIDFLAPDDQATPLADGTREIADETAAGNLGLRLRPHPIRCGALIDEDAEESPLEGVELLYTAGRANITIRHAGPVGFLAAKADALENRGATPEGTKDGYDITWWTLHAADSPQQAAELVVQRPAFRHEQFVDSVHQLKQGFAESDYPGPSGYAIEHTGLSEGDDEFEQARNESYIAVSGLIAVLEARLWE